ncbi:MAG: helix-turn-helix transcriptional regulator [Bacilli bacterium]|jgi:transcriptional regulator with XRE-family HTH domain|nr:helix-turn-helix transcriptional regulator [Bacilli bacterium]
MNYGAKMKEIRMANNVLQKDIASIMGLSVFTYSHYETEDTTIPLKHLIAFCDYFKIRIDYILGLDSKYELESGYNIVDILICAKRLKEFRKANKITQDKLAKILNTNQSVIANYERGRTLIALPFLYTICSNYKISADYLLGRI